MRKGGITAVMLLFALPCHAQGQDAIIARTMEENEIIAVVERFLAAYGANNFDAMEAMVAPGACAGYASLRDTTWSTGTMPWKDYVAHGRAKPDPVMYTEPVQHYTIHITEGRIASVLADATYSPNGKPPRHNIDHFTLIRIDGLWKFLSLAYVGLPMKQ